jgi:D-aspartate ligase
VTFRLFVDSLGMDVARALYCDVTGQPVRVGQPCPGRRWQVENLDLASAARHMRGRELSIRGWLCSLRGIDERAWYAGDDPRPFLAMCCSLVCASFRWVLRLDRGRVSRARATRLDLAPAARENY